MKNTTLSEQFQNPIEKIIERNKIDTPNIQIHDGIFSWLGTGTSINCDGVRLVVRTQISLLSEMTGMQAFSTCEQNANHCFSRGL